MTTGAIILKMICASAWPSIDSILFFDIFLGARRNMSPVACQWHYKSAILVSCGETADIVLARYLACHQIRQAGERACLFFICSMTKSSFST